MFPKFISYNICSNRFIYVGIPEELYDRINVNGSGISLGHPLGATLAVRACGLVNEMKKRNVRYGLEGTPGAGAIALAGVFERR